MPANSENPQWKVESDNLKFGGLAAALGLAAAIGSLAIPNHSKALENLEASVATAGVVVFMKGTGEAIEAMNRLDELEKKNT